MFLFWFLPETDPGSKERDEAVVRSIYDEALVNGQAYRWLDFLANEIGGRLSGSPQAAMAVEWSYQVMDTLGLDSVWKQPVMVPHWVRGEKEFAKFFSPNYLGDMEVAVCALGGSVATSREGITAQVVEVNDYDELKKLGRKQVEGKIVFFNVPMDHRHINTFHAYGHCAGYRFRGAGEAGKYGAVAMLMRSVGSQIDVYPHTGSMSYPADTSIPRIPAAAISTVHANELSQALKIDPDLKFHLRQHCYTLPDKLSYNVIGEIRGSEFPDEFIVVSGHLDSWDIGDGAHDDGAGCVQSIEVLRIFRALDIRPKRTIRAVMYMNEENGARGGIEYAAEAKRKGEKHLAAIESDRGGFTPQGFDVFDSLAIVHQLQNFKDIYEPFDVFKFIQGWGGVDINFLKELGTVCIGLVADSQRYFDYHHCALDTFDKVNQRELHLGAAAMAALVYLIDQHGLER